MSALPILVLNIHSLCNCRCVMCDIWRRKEGRELSAASLEVHRESLVRLGVRQVVLSGGEPLLHRDLAAIGEFFRSLNVRVTLLTSGLLLQKRAALVAAFADEVILSLDGPAEIHNAVRGIRDAFQITARGVAAIQKIRPSIRVSCRTTVQKQNHLHLSGTVEAAHLLELNGISFLPADLSSSAFNRDQPWDANRKSQIALTHAEIRAMRTEIEGMILKHSRDIESGFIVEGVAKLRRLPVRFQEHLDGSQPRSPRCNAPWVSTVMEVDGTLRPCFFQPPIASTTQMTLEQALNSPDARAFRSGLDVDSNPICQRCVCSINYKGS